MKTRQIYTVSLGCPKARVDTEVLLAHAEAAAIVPTDEPTQADFLLVNTCSFLESAIEESVDTILELAEYKAQSAAKLIVTGCLPARFGDSLLDELPEVDHFLGTTELHQVAAIFEEAQAPRNLIAKVPGQGHMRPWARVNTAEGAYAYLKISEGCNRSCAFCTIPAIRGKQRSRPIEALVAEAKTLVEQGAREIALVAQDLTYYGVEQGQRGALVELIDALEAIEDLHWIRLLYCYPWNFTEALIQRLGCGKVLPYVDIPLQHNAPELLRAMRRGVDPGAQAELIQRLRQVPNLVLRTTLITGFPGESEAQHQALLEWIKAVRFDRLGVFIFSPEEGTVAATLPDPVPQATAQRRYEEILQVQQQIHGEKMADLIGQELTVLVDGISPEHELVLQGRYFGQAPEVDGVVFLSLEEGAREPKRGEFVKVHIDQSSAYDLLGIVLDEDEQ